MARTTSSSNGQETIVRWTCDLPVHLRQDIAYLAKVPGHARSIGTLLRAAQR